MLELAHMSIIVNRKHTSHRLRGLLLKTGSGHLWEQRLGRATFELEEPNEVMAFVLGAGFQKYINVIDTDSEDFADAVHGVFKLHYGKTGHLSLKCMCLHFPIVRETALSLL